MKTIAGFLVALLLGAGLLVGCSDDDDNGTTTQDGALADSSQPGSDTSQPGADTSQPGADTSQPGADTSQPGSDTSQPGDDGGSLPPDLTAWCVGNTAKLRIGTQDQSWDEMDGPGSMTGTVMTIEPQFTVGGVKHSFFLTVNYTQTSLSPLTVDLANLAAGESVKKGGSTGPEVPADRRKGIVEIVSASGGGFVLKVCVWVDGESYYFPGMPMG